MYTQHPTLTYDIMVARREQLSEELIKRQIACIAQEGSATTSSTIRSKIGHLVVRIGGWMERENRRPAPIVAPETTASLAR